MWNINDSIEYLNENKDIENEELVNVVFCKTEKENLLSVTVHHFLIDLISWEVLVKDFKAAVEQLKNGEEISLTQKTASFKLWSEVQREYAETITEETKEYWGNINKVLDNTRPLNTQAEVNKAERYRIAFDEDKTRMLFDEANKTYSTRTNEILLVALGIAVTKLTNTDAGIMVESHGRTELHKSISIERTVGWFTSCFPVVIKNNNNIVKELINTKETMRRIPKNGIEYLLLNESFHKNTDVIFNFYQNTLAEEQTRNEIVSFKSETSLFKNKISVDCTVVDNVLAVHIAVLEGKHKANITEELGLEFKKQIEKLIEICTETTAVTKTLSDFTDDGLTTSELQELKAWNENVEDVYRLTPSQEGVYAQYFQSNDTKTYQLQNVVRIGKETSLEKLEKRVELLSVRHVAL